VYFRVGGNQVLYLVTSFFLLPTYAEFFSRGAIYDFMAEMLYVIL